MSEPSKRMKELVTILISAAGRDGFETGRDSDKFVSFDAEEDALLTAIAALEQRAEKWKRVAVAKQVVEMRRLTHKPITAAMFQEMRDAIAALGDEWAEAVK